MILRKKSLFVASITVVLIVCMANGEDKVQILSGWAPALNEQEKGALDIKNERNEENFLKSATLFRDIWCPSGATIKEVSDKFIILEAEWGCYIQRIGSQFIFKGNIKIEKKSMLHLSKMRELIDKAKKHGFKSFEFVLGYEDDLNSRMKNTGVMLKNYIASNIVPNEQDNYLQITILNDEVIKGLKIPAKSQVIFSKDSEGRDEVGAISNDNTPILLNELQCGSLSFPTPNSIMCQITKDIDLDKINYPKSTGLEIATNSIKGGKLNILSAQNGVRDIQVGNEIVPKNSKIVFSKGSHKVIPPEEVGN